MKYTIIYDIKEIREVEIEARDEQEALWEFQREDLLAGYFVATEMQKPRWIYTAGEEPHAIIDGKLAN